MRGLIMGEVVKSVVVGEEVLKSLRNVVKRSLVNTDEQHDLNAKRLRI
jgi:hypothetical protein